MKKQPVKIIPFGTRQWLSIAEAAEYLGVSKDTLRRWEKRGKLTARRTVGGHRRYGRKQLENILKQPMAQVFEPKPKLEQKPKTISTAKPIYQSHITQPIRKQTLTITPTKPAKSRFKSDIATAGLAAIIAILLIASFILLQRARTKDLPSQPLSPIPQSQITSHTSSSLS